MAERKDIDDDRRQSGEPPAAGASKIELPTVESPSISPRHARARGRADRRGRARDRSRVAAEYAARAATAKRFTLQRAAQAQCLARRLGGDRGCARRRRRRAGDRRLCAARRIDVAGLEETKAMQQSIAQLAKEITTLKASVEAANKAAHSADRQDHRALRPRAAPSRHDHRLDFGAADRAPPLPPHRVPAPRRAPRVAAAPAARPPAGGAGLDDPRRARRLRLCAKATATVYQVVPGAPLPGLGPVESIKRQDGRWVVMTPKGIIVSHARPPLFRVVLTPVLARILVGGAPDRRRFHLRVRSSSGPLSIRVRFTADRSGG